MLSRLLLSSNHAIAIAAHHIRLIARESGLVLADAGADAAVPICCVAVDSSGTYLASCTEDKLLSLWRIDGLTLLNTRPLPKRPTAIEFSRDAQTIVVADKFGDVFSYPLHYTPLTEKQSRDALTSHENPSGGTLVLGHTSLLTALLLSHDERYIITADRDEHIRVSWFPQGFVIEMYCLGHEKYVSAIHVPPCSPSVLVSGGGDPVLKVWDWMSGAIQFELDILDAIRPFVVVAVKPKRGGDNDDDDPRSNSKGKNHKRKNPATEELAQPRYVLVIHRIASIQHEGQIRLFFNAVGATALFTCALTSNAVVQSFDLQKPVLDFCISEDGLVWAILDGNWTRPGEYHDTTSNVVRILRLTPSGELAEVTTGPHDRLLASLTEFSAATTDDRNLDFYADLTWLPKHNEGIDAKSDRAPSEGPGGSDEEQEKQLTKREQGRLRNKRKVQAKAQEAAVKAFEDEEKVEPATKRSKS